MPKKHSFEYVKKYIESYDCELLSKEYINAQIKLRIKFSCGHIDENKTFADFKVIARKICSDCSCDKFSYQYIKNYIESFDCELLDNDYINNMTPLKIKFVCGHIGYRTFGKFQDRKNKFCRKCAGNKKYENQEIIDEIGVLGFTLDGKYEGANKRVTVIDKNGYKFYCTVNNLRDLPKRNRQEMPLVSKDNPYCFDNIRQWLMNNNKRFSLSDSNKYTRAKGKLLFNCLVCTEDFISTWDKISRGIGCPFCAGMKVGRFNNLLYLFPNVAKDWDYDKNFPIRPENIRPACNKKFWWICPKGHSYDCVPGSKTKVNGTKCRYCTGREATPKNNFAKAHSELLEEWDYAKNSSLGLFPDKLTPGSQTKVWWKCASCDYSWEKSICARTHGCGNGCPNCNRSNGVKRIDQFLRLNNIPYLYNKELFDDLYGEMDRKLRYDFVIFSDSSYKNIIKIIEWDGGQHDRYIPHFHKTLEKYDRLVRYDNIKNEYAKSNNLDLIRLKEQDFKCIFNILTYAFNFDLNRKEVITL